MIGYFSDRAVLPGSVCDGDVERFAWELETFSLRGRPTDIVHGAIRGWNAAVEQIPGWPSRPLTLPSRERRGYVLAAEDLSAAFRSSLAEYMVFLADPPDETMRHSKACALQRLSFESSSSAKWHQLWYTVVCLWRASLRSEIWLAKPVWTRFVPSSPNITADRMLSNCWDC
jgi:hypothetical protein